MTTKRIGDAARAARKRAASASLYTVGAHVRGLPAKIWIASQPISVPASIAFQTPPLEPTCAPKYMLVLRPVVTYLSEVARDRPLRRPREDLGAVLEHVLCIGHVEVLPIAAQLAVGVDLH